MKLVWHEFKTLATRWKWFIPLWWLSVFIDLGYQTTWWWDGPQGWVEYADFHNPAYYLIRTGIWFGLGLSTLIIFLGISPEQIKTATRLRPISGRGRLLSRLLFLAACIGLPWWLHELYYLSAIAKVPAWNVALGVFERILATIVFWFFCGSMGWVSGTFIRVTQLAGVSTVILIFLVKLDELTHWFTPHISVGARHSWTEWSRYGNWAHFGAALAMGCGLLFWLWLKNRKPGRTNLGTWLAFVTIVAAISLLHQFLILWSSEFLLSGSALSEQEKTESLFSNLSTVEPFNIPPGNGSSHSWTVQPDFPEMPEYFADISEASGEMTLSNGNRLPLATQSLPNHYGNESEVGQSNLPNYVAAFSDFMIFGHPFRGSSGHKENVFLYPRGKDFTMESPDDFKAASADVHIDLLRKSEWHSLPLNGSTHKFGSLGSTKFANRKENFLYILATPVSHYFKITDALDPFRQFALVNREKKQLILLSEKPQNQSISGVSSAAPLYELRLSIGNETPLSFANPDWLKNAELLMMEAPLVGRVQKEFRTDRAVKSDFNFPSEQLYSIPEIGLTSSNLTQPWSAPGASEDQIRKAVYEVVRAQSKDEIKIQPFAAEHRNFLRRLALKHPALLGVFEKQWNDDDRDWFLTKLDTTGGEAFTHEHINNEISKEWLKERPDWVKKNLNSPHPTIRWTVLEIATRLGLEEGKKQQYRHSIWNLYAPAVQRETYPEIWDETAERCLELWKENRWALRAPYGRSFSYDLQLGRMGIQKPLRERLESIIVMEPEYSENVSGRFQHYLHGKEAWKYLGQLFRVKESALPTTSEEKVALAEKWLASNWEYDPATMTYSLKP